MDTSALTKLKQHYRQLQNDRRSHEPFWLDVRRLLTPQRGRMLLGSGAEEVNNGVKDDRRINAAASRALAVLANGMQSGLTSKARQWFILTHPDPELNRWQPVREWYDLVQEVLEGVFRRSNLYSDLLHTYVEMAGFGQGALMVLSHPDKMIYCRSFTTGTYYMSADEWREVDTFFQVEQLTARQLVRMYGRDVLPAYIRDAYDRGNYEDRYEVVNAILRHPEAYDITIGPQYTVASVHFLTGSDGRGESGFLRKSGYRTWPVMTPRWDAIDNDVYGWAPTRDIIGDVKMLQKMESDALKGVAKSVSPPWRIPPELDRRGLNTEPGALNVVSNPAESAVAPLYSTPVNIQQLQYKIDSVVNSIKEGMFNSLFMALLMQDNPQMTAREVAERHEEKLLMLGPVLERIHYELLDPLIDRAFALCWEAGAIPPPPEELRGQPTQIEYVSILSQAQKAVGVNRIEQSVQFLGSMATIYPELRNALDPYKTYQEYNHMIGVRAGIFRTEQEYSQLVAAEQQKAEMAQFAESANKLAAPAKVMTDADPANVMQLLTGSSEATVL